MVARKRAFRFWLLPIAIPLWLLGWAFLWADSKEKTSESLKKTSYPNRNSLVKNR